MSEKSEADMAQPVESDTDEITVNTEETEPAETQERQQPAPEFPAETPVKEMSGNEQAAYWKKQSRKHEDQEKQYRSQMRDAQDQMQELKAENTRLKLQAQYPQLTDQVLSLCSETEPEKIAEWGGKMAGILAASAPGQQAEPAESANDAARQVMRAAQAASVPQASTGAPSYKDAYRKAMESYSARK